MTPDKRQKKAAYARQTRLQKWHWVKSYLGDCCVECGSKERLELDHINPSLKDPHTWKRCTITRSREDLLKEMDNLRILCHSCHVKHTALQRKAAWKAFCNLNHEDQIKLITECS